MAEAGRLAALRMHGGGEEEEEEPAVRASVGLTAENVALKNNLTVLQDRLGNLNMVVRQCKRNNQVYSRSPALLARTVASSPTTTTHCGCWPIT